MCIIEYKISIKILKIKKWTGKKGLDDFTLFKIVQM